MDSLLKRVVCHPTAYYPIVHKQSLTLLERSLTGDLIHTFRFTVSEKPNWRAGQHGIFVLDTNRKLPFKEQWRPFSVASAPSEGIVEISTIISSTPSPYKATLNSLAVGNTITMRGPLGEFYVPDGTTRIVGVAGGVGITPLRSVLYDLAKRTALPIPTTLIYGVSKAPILYQAELDVLQSQNPWLTIHYCDGVDATTAMLNKSIQDEPTATYFLSGAPRMITALYGHLKQAGINRIITDPFKGY